MGNITGESFKDYVAKQITVRQRNLGDASRSRTQLLQQNANSAWIKLTSAIVVKNTEKFGYDADIAQKYALFGGTLAGSTVLGGLSAYTQFGQEQGPRPAPGITSFETKNRNRGSVRESTIQIKAYNRTQFDLLDVLYLRLGYSVLIEFGNSLYFDNNNVFQTFSNSDTLTSTFLDGTYTGKQDQLLTAIEAKRKLTGGNYDAIFGRISNFSWSFLPDGSYDISVTIISYGDVIESLKQNTMSEDTSATPQTTEQKEQAEEQQENAQAALDAATTDAKVIDVLQNISVLGRLFWDIKDDMLRSPGPGSNNCRSLSTANPFRMSGYSKHDAIKIHSEGSGEDYYYIRFGALLQFLWDKNMLYVDAKGQNPLLKLDNDAASNLIYKTPYTLSGNPLICVVRTKITLQGSDQDFDGDVYKDIPDEGVFQDPNSTDSGRLMNVYLNLAYLLKESNSIKDASNKVNFYDIIKKACEGFQSSLGGIIKIEPTVDADEGRFYILDEVPIPSRQTEQAKTPTVVMKIYGVNPGGEGTFVRDFGIKTEITNALASTITIGAQANGSVKGEDATAFSKWNEGLTDRILPVKNNKDETEEEKTARLNKAAELSNQYKNIQQEYMNFLQGQASFDWEEDKVSSFSSILTNMLTFTQTSDATSTNSASGGLGFLPINLNLTFDGIAGMKIYQQFTVDSSFLPRNYGSTLQFLIKGITHKIDNNQWITSVETVAVPSSVAKSTSNQSFTGIKAVAGPSGTGGTAAAPTGEVRYPSGVAGAVRLRLKRQREVFTPGATKPDGVGQTLGILQVLDGSGKLLKEYTTVEEPWRGNRSSISCIPPGRYTFTKSKANNHASLGNVLRFAGIPFRDGVLMHIGATHKDTEGCILPGIKEQLDRNGDKVPDNRGGEGTNTAAAMTQILNYLYPSGAPNSTYTIEIYGVPGQQYIESRDGSIYANPSTSPVEDGAKQSRQAYVDYVVQLNKVLSLKDAYDRGNPLLKSTVNASRVAGLVYVDNVDEGAKRMQALVNQIKQSIGGKPAPWQNKLALDKLIPDHKQIFIEQFNGLIKAVLAKNNTYGFRYPSTTNPKKLGKEAFTFKPDYG
jgi:hypothetical protein